ncbi:MAG: acyltransferase [Candidatus Levyibacteriota bacterium]
MSRQIFFDKFFHGWLYITSVFPNVYRGWLLKLRSEKVGNGLRIDKDCLFYHTSKLKIGNNVWIGRRAFISARGGLSIGDDSLIAFDSVILTEHHIYKKGVLIRTTGFSIKPTVIGNNVLIGAKAVVMPGVKIGDNVVIGINSVVTKNIPSGSIAAGVPAKIIKKW